jgi:hypothetical protein
VKSSFKIEAEVIEWRGPAPFFFARIDQDTSDLIKLQSKDFTYGWGVLHAHGFIGNSQFQTALMPKDGRYLIPLKDELRKTQKISVGIKIQVMLTLGKGTK